jgi:hypothetical protein
VESFIWLEQWGKTPIDLGARPEQVDRCWSDAMVTLKNAYQDQLRLKS